ncbi:hypothetical protein HPB51_004231 [Rhipicephalus microplus]|uniref:Uncharacterized protein n=1 Tax=Rhipicephalus microplus TaxID=6941 RepID=A0A9J6ERG1_RHIMP|nr:hypothetical protein HPB51_004231 [Rhipicephalus microplus]
MTHRASGVLLPARRQQYSDDDWRSSTASIGGGGCTETNALLHCVDDSKKIRETRCWSLRQDGLSGRTHAGSACSFR